MEWVSQGMPSGRRRRGFTALLAGIVGLAVLSDAADFAPRAAAQPMRRTVPHDAYFAVHGLLFDGNYVDALGGFQECVRSAIKTTTSYWIDSICYHAMCGETYYQMGQYGPALEHFNKSLHLFVTFNDWMIPVHFPPTIGQSQATIRPIPWGQSQRRFFVGHFPDTALIRQGRIDNSAAVQQGGVVQQAIDFPINPQEIVRCTCWSLLRRRDLLGPLAPQDQLTAQAIAVLTKRPVQPNHWTEAWLDAELGCAFAAAGQNTQARTLLEKSLVVAGQYDHPMTCIALLELGRLALGGGDFDAATRYFEESSYSAFYFADPLIIEEALRWAMITHFLANRRGPYLPVGPAAEWARREDLRQLQAHLLALAAENQCLLDEPKAASALLATAAGATARSTIMKGRVGSQLNFVQALTHYQLGNAPAGDAAVHAALAFAETGSLKMFHLALTEQMTIARTLSTRLSKETFAALLRDPLTSDWLYDPLETLAVLVFPYPLYYERWFELSLADNDQDGKRALEIAELAKRHKFLSSQELGGRLLNLRWILEGPADALPPSAQTQRQTMLAQFPGYERLSQQTRDLQSRLLQQPLTSDDPSAAKQHAALMTELETACRSQELMLKAIALRRMPADLVFPPVRPVDEVQKLLKPGHGVLSFYVGARGTYGFLLNDEKFGYWPIATADVVKRLTAVLQGFGNYDENKQMRAVDLRATTWQQPARELFDLLAKDSKADLPYGFDELAIVPDAALWYVPFEALPVTPRGDAPQPLLQRCRIRYAPTLGLAVGDRRPRLQKGKTLISLGKLYPTDDESVSEQAYAELARSLAPAEVIRPKAKLGASGATFVALADRFVALTDLPPSTSGNYAANLITGDRSAVGNSPGDWIRLPLRGPEHVALPGFHTAAETSLKKLVLAEAGNEIFLTTTALLASGTRTVLLSRWRPAGRTSTDLVREFMQELPYTSATKSWQRAAALVQQAPITPELEPRVHLDPNDAPPTPTHPFFWAAYLIVDTGSEPETQAAAK